MSESQAIDVSSPPSLYSPRSKDKYNLLFLFFVKDSNLFLERGEGREEKGEKHRCARYMDWLPLAHPLLGTWSPTGYRIFDHLVRRLALNRLSYTSQG